MILSNKWIREALAARMRRLVCIFVVRKPPKTGFLASRPIWSSLWSWDKVPFLRPEAKARLQLLKGTATLMISLFYQKDLYEPWILIQVSSKSVEKWASFWLLKNTIWSTFSCPFWILISFQNVFNCLIFSYHYYHIICVSADMQLYT